MDILLIAGLWLDGSVWDTVAAQLEARGHRAVPVTLPGQGDGNTSFIDIDSGHWPMISAPAELARLLAQVAEES